MERQTSDIQVVRGEALERRNVVTYVSARTIDVAQHVNKNTNDISFE